MDFLKVTPSSSGVKSNLGPWTLFLFAATCGASVANVYYAQPLLGSMAADFGLDTADIGIVVTLTQIGYAAGLLLIVPLADIANRRRLVITQTMLLSAAAAAVGLAPSTFMLLVAMIALGLLSVVVQVVVALTASLTGPEERGRAVGLVTSGVVIGILAARLWAGLLADLGGWRTVYLASGMLMLIMSMLLAKTLPREKPSGSKEGYVAILRSVPLLFLRYPLLRARAVLAFLIFASFSTLWTAMVLPLSASPYLMSHTAIGLFGLAGVAGALAASGAGRLADRGLAQPVTGASLALLAISWAAILCLPASLPVFLLGVVALDFAVQAVHVTNQTLILAARPEARSRLVGGYMVFYSAGSALGAITSTMIYAYAGWPGVCALGCSFSVMALVFWWITRPMPRA
ncbi:MFS transporter [Rhizobium sp. BG4]|uniref:MFS transporter n=1 Tax=Rhizobium sp. BG4 TaxID=2613770 RepID=UPI00193D3114|nr:MFS transporter [Rhizobium sp. BG4]QRM42072.1 MFS transporter [Rhizobium sp. BG4]